MLNKLFSVSISLLLTACASTPPTNFYILEALSQPSVTTVNNDKKRLIGIGPLSQPSLLDRRQIVTRQKNNTIQLAEFHQWAAPLKDNILAVLSKNIAAQQPNSVIKPYPWNAYGEMDYRIIIDISRFDSQLEQAATLEASWSIMEEKNHTIIRNGQTKLTEPLPNSDYENLVHVMNKLLDKFSQQLSATIQQLP